MPATRKKGSGFGKNLVQGTYEPVNKEKYVGKKHPRYLSSWELHVFRYMDHHDKVIEWGSETTIVKYYDQRVQRTRRYMVDVYMKVKQRNGDIKTFLCEVKPYKQTMPPVKTARKRQDVFESEQNTYITNRLKWAAAEKYCEERSWHFIILTEFQIFKNGKG